jgi:deoxyribonuclease I
MSRAVWWRPWGVMGMVLAGALLVPPADAKLCRNGVARGGSCIAADKVCHRSAPQPLPSAASPRAATTAPRTFREAKRVAPAIYAGHQRELYCGCAYSDLQHVDLAGCGYQPRAQPQRASRIEWEHIVPAWVFGHQLQCWQDGGRKQCERSSAQFNRMEADLRNLYPAIGEVNADRSNFGYGMLPGAQPLYGQCGTVVDFKQRVAMPRAEVRGLVARTWLYMAARYGLRLSRQDRQLYQAWDRMYPESDWERLRLRRIAAIQGS